MNRSRSRVWFGLFGFIGLALAASATRVNGPYAAETTVGGDNARTLGNGLPPLVVDRDAPLLSDAPAASDARSPTGSPPARNSACFVCHANYREELLASEHERHGVGCVDCHGKSYAHRNDENNTTPPEIMYPAYRIDAGCQQCHHSHDAPARKVIAVYLQRCAQKSNLVHVVCTVCHGQHRMAVRTVRWDKQTGKLLVDTQK